MEAPGEITAEQAAEGLQQQGRDLGQGPAGTSARRAASARSCLSRGRQASSATLETPRTSWSMASAAIQPDIITMGMPGPGWAAPPAR